MPHFKFAHLIIIKSKRKKERKKKAFVNFINLKKERAQILKQNLLSFFFLELKI